MFALRSFCAAAGVLVVQAVDPFVTSVGFLLTGNTAGSGTAVDSGPNNYTGTLRQANALTIMGPVSPFGPGVGGSLLITGGNAAHTAGVGGTGNGYVTATSQSWLGTGDFTVEFFFYMIGNFAQYMVTEFTGVGSTNWGFQYDTTGSAGLVFGTGSSTLLQTGTSAITLNRWHHVAVMQIGSTMAMFLNGTQVASRASMTTLTDSSNLCVGASNNNGQVPFDGYITNVRIVKGGTQPYGSTMPSSITVPTAPLTSTGSNTMILLKFDTAAVVDSSRSTNVYPGGSLAPSTSQSKYGGASLSYNGTNQYARVPYAQLKGPGLGDFTMEMWVYQDGTTKYIFDASSAEGYGVYPLIISSSGGAFWQGNSSGTNVVFTNSISNNTWTHLAICRSNGVTYAYKNGVLNQSLSDSINYAFQPDTYIGAASQNNAPGYFFTGYMDDFRYTLAARYPGGTTFTPQAFSAPYPTTALGSSELYLTFDTGAAVDTGIRSGTAAALTLNNTSVTFATDSGTRGAATGTQVATFAGPASAVYSNTSVNLYLPSSLDFTIEAWIRFDTLPSVAGGYSIIVMLSKGSQANWTTDHTIVLYVSGTTNKQAVVFTNGATSSTEQVGTTAITGSSWNHVAFTYSSYSKYGTFWLNGNFNGRADMSTYAPQQFQQGQVAQRATLGRGDLSISTASMSQSGGLYGSLDNVRIAKGVQLYKIPFTPT